MDIQDFLTTYLPLLLVSLGALISEYAGVMAIFLEGILNLGAFLTFALSIFTQNPLLGFLFACIICALFVFLAAIFTENTQSNPFLVGISVNLLSTGITTLLSSIFFKTRGVVAFSEIINFSETKINTFNWLLAIIHKYSNAFSIFVCLFIITAMLGTKWGMRVKITGSDPDVLVRFGINPAKYRILSWVIPAGLAAITGGLKTFRLSSYVPNMSSGLGWIAIALVFLGHKKLLGIILASFAFSLLEMLAIFLQGISNNIPPTLLLSVPYILSILLLTFTPKYFSFNKKKS